MYPSTILSTLAFPFTRNFARSLFALWLLPLLLAWAQIAQEVRPLELGKPIERELASGQQHDYSITVAAGQYLNAVVEQRGINVEVMLFGPDSKQLFQFNSDISRQGMEEVTQVAEVTGSYRLTVRAQEQGAPPGRYLIRLAELRTATENDRALQEARGLTAEGRSLYGAGKYDEALPMIARALELRERALAPGHPEVAAALNSLATIHFAKRDYAAAEPLHQRALAMREKALGPEHLAVAVSLNNLARLYSAQGDYAKAEPLQRRALAVRERLLGPEHSETVNSLAHLADVAYNQGNKAKAEPLYRRLLVAREKELGPEHPGVLAVLDVLADLYTDKGDYGAAESLYRRILATREKALGPEQPEVASTLNDLALLYATKGEYAAAEPLYQRALAMRERALGPEHSEVADSLNTLANLYSDKGDYAAAEPLYRRALAIREKTFGPEHTDVASVLNNLATLYRDKGEYANAEPLLQRALAIRERRLGPEHPEVAVVLGNLALLYNDKGEYANAELLQQRALAIREKALGPENPEVATSLVNLAIVYNFKGDYAKAESLHQRALAIREKALGPGHPLLAKSLSSLAQLYASQGDYAKAEPLYRRALAIREKTFGPEHSEVAGALNDLAAFYGRQGDYTAAEPFQQRALAIWEQRLGPEHPEVAIALNNLAVIYTARGEYARAEALHRRALAIRERILGPEHPKVAVSLDNLANHYRVQGDLAQAIAFQARAVAVSERNIALNLAAGSERQKLAYLTLSSFQFDRAVSLHAQAAPTDRAARNLALTVILRRKGRLLEAQADSLAALLRRADDNDRALLGRLRETSAELGRLIFNGPQRLTPAEHQAKIKALEERQEQLQDGVSRRSAAFRAQTSSVTVAAVQAAVPAQAALVEFARYHPFKTLNENGAPRYVAYVLRPQAEIQWAELGDAESIEETIDRWRQALRDKQRGNVKQLARAVDEKLMRPVRALLGSTTRIFISPDGALNLLPFAALVSEDNHYLIERYTFSYLTSGRDLLRLQIKQPPRQRALVVADPDFGKETQGGKAPERILKYRPGTQAATGEGALLSEYYFPQLAGTAEEARALKAMLVDATVLTQAQATEAALKRASGPLLLHVATHGFFLEDKQPPAGDDRLARQTEGTEPLTGRIENPLLRSGLALAGANLRLSDNKDDGILTAQEAAGLDLWGTKLVVLSACDTGVGEVKNGEGVYGLRRALVLAGSETQVMSLWPVSDKGTRDLMIGYYRRLQRGEGRTEALRQAQLQMLTAKGTAADEAGRLFVIKRQKEQGRILTAKSGKKPGAKATSNDYSHPYYWASFIQSGEWANLDGK